LNEAESLHAQLQPVANALDRLQFDSPTVPQLQTLMKNGSVFWELMHWNHIWRLLLITTCLQICYSRNTKENICLKLMKKLPHNSCSWSFVQSIQKLLHSLQVQTLSQLHFYQTSVTCVDRKSPVLWWTSVSNCNCKVSPCLISTALKIPHLPSSSAATKCVFYNFVLVQSQLRNQLGSEKAAKLCIILQTAAWNC